MTAASDTARPFERVHFIGVGGAGMSGIALVLHERGYQVSGSDLKTSRYVRQLTRAGVDVHIGHRAETVDAVAPEVVVISSAIPDANPELARARELGIPVWPRAKMLSYLGHGRMTVAVAGTHGKTTTSSMCATMLDRMGLEPSFLIGGIVEGYDTNGKNGAGQYFVCEADESDSSFLYLDPHVAVVTNIEEDHMDHYHSLEEIEQTFAKFMALVGPDGVIVACGDSPRVAAVAASTGCRVVTYGFDEGNDVVCCGGPRPHSIGSDLTVTLPGGAVVKASVEHNPGRHNILNATACLTVAHVLGLDMDKAARALSTFQGARRRFTHVGDVNGVTVVDDYGHHPTEIKATLAAAKELDFDRVVVVFQPHRYSRLQALLDQFADAFANADEMVLIDVFSAGEMPIPGVTSKLLADAIERAHPGKPVRYVPNRAEVSSVLKATCRPGDLLITMGAGDVTNVGPEFIESCQA